MVKYVDPSWAHAFGESQPTISPALLMPQVHLRRQNPAEGWDGGWSPDPGFYGPDIEEFPCAIWNFDEFRDLPSWMRLKQPRRMARKKRLR